MKIWYINALAGSYLSVKASISTLIMSSVLLWPAFPVILSCNKRKSFTKYDTEIEQVALFSTQIQREEKSNSFFSWEIKKNTMLSFIKYKGD